MPTHEVRVDYSRRSASSRRPGTTAGTRISRRSCAATPVRRWSWRRVTRSTARWGRPPLWRSWRSSRSATATRSRCRGSVSCATSSPTRSWCGGRSPGAGRPRRTCPASAFQAPPSWARTIGLAPDRRLLEATIAREQAALDRGGFVLPPDPTDAVPADPAIAAEALRTVPPRETAGNVDIKQLSAGTRMYVPVYADSGLFSAGDAHFAQGDSETCGTAIEMRATLHVRFSVRKGVAASRGIRDLQFARDDYHLAPEFAAPRRFHATTGLSVTRDGENRPEDLTLAARNAR